MVKATHFMVMRAHLDGSIAMQFDARLDTISQHEPFIMSCVIADLCLPEEGHSLGCP